MSDVFISHSSKDKEIADALVGFLESRGISCWIAPRNIVPGSDWAASISTAVTSSKIFLLIYSENSAVSTQCPREVSLAETAKGVTVVPYKTDDTPLNGTYQYYLTGAHWISANIKKKDYKYDELYAFLAGILGKSGQTINANTYINDLHIHNPAPIQPSKPHKPVNKKAIIIAAAAAVVVVGAVGIIIAALNSGGVPVSGGGISSVSVTPVSNISDHPLSINFCENTVTGTYTGEINSSGEPEGHGEFDGTYNSTDENDTRGTRTIHISGMFAKGQLNGTSEIHIDFENGGYTDYPAIDLIDGEFSGTIEYTAVNADGDKTEYKAETSGGKFNGRVIYTTNYANGDKYVFDGEYKDHKKNGMGTGTYTYADGNIHMYEYVGEYKDGSRNGEGTLTNYYSNGATSVFKGEFKDGKKYNGTYTGYYSDGTLQESIEYKNGEQVS